MRTSRSLGGFGRARASTSIWSPSRSIRLGSTHSAALTLTCRVAIRRFTCDQDRSASSRLSPEASARPPRAASIWNRKSSGIAVPWCTARSGNRGSEEVGRFCCHRGIGDTYRITRVSSELDRLRMERRAKREARRAKQREQNVVRAAKMHAARLEFERPGAAVPRSTAGDDANEPAIHVGCSGWFYWHWRDCFYP